MAERIDTTPSSDAHYHADDLVVDPGDQTQEQMDLFAPTEITEPVGPPSDLYKRARQRNKEFLEGGRTFRVTSQTAGRLAATQFLDKKLGQ